MVLSIFFAILLFLLAFAAVVLCAPITLACSGTTGTGEDNGILRCSWLHPRALKAVLDMRNGRFEVIAFGKYRLYAGGMQPEAGEPPAAPHPAVKEATKTAAAAAEPPEAPRTPPPDRPPIDKREPPAAEKEAAGATSPPAPGKKSGPRSRFAMVKRLWVFLGNESFRRKMLRWLRRLVRSLLGMCRIARIRVHVKAGFSDPAQTGVFYGWYQGISHMLNLPGSRRLEAVYEPEFSRKTFEADGEAVIATSGVRLCLPLVKALATFPYVHAFVLYRRAGKVG
jgi:hypothetical protein